MTLKEKLKSCKKLNPYKYLYLIRQRDGNVMLGSSDWEHIFKWLKEKKIENKKVTGYLHSIYAYRVWYDDEGE